mgnify:CR=1 FL=1
MTKILDELVFALAVAGIVMAMPAVIWWAFYALYQFWSFVGVW